MNNFSITFKQERISKLLKFLTTITKDRTKFNSVDSHLVILRRDNIIIFKYISPGMCSLYEYIIRSGEEMYVSGDEEQKQLIVNVQDFITKIIDRGMEKELDIIESYDQLKFKSTSAILDGPIIITYTQLYAIEEPKFCYEENEEDLIYEAKISMGGNKYFY